VKKKLEPDFQEAPRGSINLKKGGTNMNQTKKAYRKPELRAYGKATDLTLNTNVGTHLDATLPSGTPFGVVLTHLST
jgi:hypothetical protein